MAQKVFLGMKQTIKKTNITLSYKELFKTSRKWFTDRSYDVWEIEADEIDMGSGKKKYHIFWKCDRRLAYYAKIRFEYSVDFMAEDVVIEDKGKQKTTQKGDVTISFNPYIMKDVEEEWTVQEKSGLRRFLREAYDTFFEKSKYKAMEEDMKKDLETIKYDMKRYINQKRLD